MPQQAAGCPVTIIGMTVIMIGMPITAILWW